MATLREVRSRIVGVKKTQKITRAMKMVAVARLRQAQQNVVSARPYARKIGELLRNLLGQVPAGRDVLLDGREVRTVALVVVTADRGLCGAFNTNLIRATQNTIATKYPGWLKRRPRASLLHRQERGRFLRQEGIPARGAVPGGVPAARVRDRPGDRPGGREGLPGRGVRPGGDHLQRIQIDQPAEDRHGTVPPGPARARLPPPGRRRPTTSTNRARKPCSGRCSRGTSTSRSGGCCWNPTPQSWGPG